MGEKFTDSIKKYAELEGTLVFLMGLKNLRYITDSLMKYGKDKNMPACVMLPSLRPAFITSIWKM